jgi:hypothetical protein
MKSIIGVFDTIDEAQRAASELRESGIDPQYITVLAPGSPEQAWNRVPLSGTEQSGMGEAMGGVVGGAVGAAAGAPLGAALASLILPGVGPIVAIGIAGAALLGLGGAAAGVAAGKALEDHMFTGVPEDEVFFYEDALRRGHAVTIAFAHDEKQADAARCAMADADAESVDAARESWWLGVRDAEKEHYEADGANFGHDEHSYRHGFEAALRPSMRSKTYAQAADDLRAHYKDADSTCFRRGYERGHAHLNEILADREAPWLKEQQLP